MKIFRTLEEINNIDDKAPMIQFDDSYEVDYRNTPSITDIKRGAIVPENEKKRILFVSIKTNL